MTAGQVLLNIFVFVFLVPIWCALGCAGYSFVVPDNLLWKRVEIRLAGGPLPLASTWVHVGQNTSDNSTKACNVIALLLLQQLGTGASSGLILSPIHTAIDVPIRVAGDA